LSRKEFDSICVRSVIGQLLERTSYEGVDVVLSGETHDAGRVGSVGDVEGFASACVVSTPRPPDDVIAIGEDRA
jgi:hypothetical protein